MANESILTGIKKDLGIEEEYTYFDHDIIDLINANLNTLTQIGVGPENGFVITGTTETWSDFLGDKIDKLQIVKTYLYIRVRMIFDPPQTSFVLDALKEHAKELEWRISVEVDPKDETEGD